METVLIPDLVSIVAEYALIPADTPEAVHWANCEKNPAYAQWWPVAELVRVCGRGSLDLAIWLTRAYIPPDIVCANIEVFWEIALVGGLSSYMDGKPPVAGRFSKRPRVPLPSTGTRAALVVESGALSAACFGGHIETVQWLVAEYGVTAVEVRSFYNRVLFDACKSGRVELIGWLRRTFDLSAEDATEDAQERGGALSAVCCSDSLEALQYIAREFEYNIVTVRANCIRPLALLLVKGHFHTAQWLVDTFGLTKLNWGAEYGADILERCIAQASHVSCPEAALYWLQGMPEI